MHGLLLRYHRLRNHFGRARSNSYVTWVMSHLGLNRLETVLVSAQDSCMVSAKHTMAQKLFWTHQMVLLCNEAQVEAHFGPFGDSANLDARYEHGLRRTYHRLVNRFGRTRWNS